MPFPISLSGTIRTSVVHQGDASFEYVLDALKNALHSQGSVKISRDAQSLSFRPGFFRSRNNVLAVIDRGRLSVLEDKGQIEVRYVIGFHRALILVTAMVLVGFAPWLLFGKLPFMTGLLYVCMIWLWLFGANYLISLVRFPRFLRTSIRAASSGRNGD
jgi:hypothetical protein